MISAKQARNLNNESIPEYNRKIDTILSWIESEVIRVTKRFESHIEYPVEDKYCYEVKNRLERAGYSVLIASRKDTRFDGWREAIVKNPYLYISW